MNNGPFAHLTSSKTASHVEEYALAGNSYSYYVRAYDFAGNRGLGSNQTKVEIPADFAVPEGKQIALDGDVDAEMGFSACDPRGDLKWLLADDMLDFETSHLPGKLEVLEAATKELRFNLGSDLQTGALLRTLAATKPGGAFWNLAQEPG